MILNNNECPKPIYTTVLKTKSAINSIKKNIADDIIRSSCNILL